MSPLTDRGFVEAAIRRQYKALLDTACDEILAPLYPGGMVFEVNGETLGKLPCGSPEMAPLAIRSGRKRKPSAAGYLFRETEAVDEDQRGVAISTYGKVIKRGWNWVGVSPAAPDRTGGLIEFPALAAALTLNKGDFIRTGPRGAVYLAARKAIQEVVVRQLAAWGDNRDQAEAPRPRSMRTLERDLERALLELREGFPLLASLVEQRRGGQKRLPLAPQSNLGGGLDFGAGPSPDAPGAPQEPLDTLTDTGAEQALQESQPPSRPPEDQWQSPAGSTGLPDARARPRPVKLGLAVQFEERSGDPELGRLVESTIYVNRAHPAYLRAVASRSEGYHIALSVALALAPIAVEPAGEHAFVTALLSRWGEAVSPAALRRKRPTTGRPSKLF